MIYSPQGGGLAGIAVAACLLVTCSISTTASAFLLSLPNNVGRHQQTSRRPITITDLGMVVGGSYLDGLSNAAGTPPTNGATTSSNTSPGLAFASR